MRSHMQKKQNRHGPLGIRIGVWLTVFGLLVLGVLPLSLVHHRNARRTDPAAYGSPDPRLRKRLGS